MRARRTACTSRIAVVAGEAGESELQHHFARARGPGALALDILKTFEEAANIEQQTCEFRTNGVKRLMDALARRDHCIGKCAGAFAAAGMAAGRQRLRPV